MNGFADLAVVFGRAEPPTRHRLTNPWSLQATGPGGIWSAHGSNGPLCARSHPARAAWRIWVVGDVFSYRGSFDRIPERLIEDLDTGDADPESLDAHAVVIAWDDGRRRLHVLSDRLGTVHIYVGRDAAGVCVSTFAPTAAGGATSDLDWEAITGFCSFGFYPADRTMYRGVRIVRPATWSTFDDRGSLISEKRYWNWSYEPDESRSDAELIDEFHEVFGRTVRVQLGGRRVVIPVSGGLDSRTILAAAVRDSEPASIETFTYGYSASSREIDVASRVSRAAGTPAHEYVVGSYLFDRIDDIVGAVEGFGALTFSRQVAISAQLPLLGERVVGGHLGDLWFDDAGVPDTVGSTSSELVDLAMKKFTRSGSTWLIDNVCGPHLNGEDPAALVRGFIESELARLPDLGDANFQLSALKLEQWSFRWTISGLRAYQLGLPTLVPFYGNDVVDFFLRVPTRRLAGRRLQVAYLARYHPELAAVTWESSGMPLRPNRVDRAQRLVTRAVHKAARSVGRRSVVQRNWEVQFLTGDGPHHLRALHRDASVRFGIDAGQVTALDDALIARPDAANGYSADALATLVAALTT